jgi:hypothetical protein
MGIPVEESVLQLAAGGATLTALVYAGRTTLGRFWARLKRR